MKNYLQAYLNLNLGDDLFVDIISKRYEKQKFYVLAGKNYKDIFNSNIKIKNSIYVRILKKIVVKLNIAPERLFFRNYDNKISIGGSMFIENHDRNFKYRIKTNIKNQYYIGSNFGPYETEHYFKGYYNIFKNAKDVCFREKYSYNLFKDIENVRYAPDIVFSMDISKIEIQNEKRVIISVIDCERKCDVSLKEKYENKIIQLIQFFLKREYRVTLMSFCKAEKDEDAIQSILLKCSDKFKRNIDTYFYSGNLKEAIEIISKSQVIVGSRFHANILGLLFQKTVIPICYSKKTINVLEDMEFKGCIIDIKEIDNWDVNKIPMDSLIYKYDVSKQIKKAEEQFKELDKLFLEDKK